MALDDISFDINEGEFVFLVGPSGSGKTTIIKHLIREEKPTQGRVYFDDDDVTKYKRGQVYSLRRKIGVIFQDYKLIEEKDAYENVAFAMEAAGHNDKDIKETVPYVLEIVGLGKRMSAFPEQLSGGEKQRVAIARAIANNPKLLIADEPTGNLDPEAAWDIVQILTKINNWGTTVLMCTHGSGFVDALGKRVIRLEKGKITKDAIKGKYSDDDLSIEKKKFEKMTKKKEKKKQDKKKSHQKKQEKDKKDDKDISKIQKSDKVEDDENDDKKPKTKKKPQPKLTLTSRQKPEPEKQSFEERAVSKFEKKEAKKKKSEVLSEKSDIKDSNFNPKLISILKAYGYDTIKSLKEAGIKKISRIDELSTRDINSIQKLLDKVNKNP